MSEPGEQMADDPRPDQGLATGESPDVEELQQEVTVLRVQLAEARRKPPRAHRIRTISMVVLIVIGSVLVPLACITVFVRSVLLNTDEYLSIVGPLPTNPAVASVISTKTTDILFKQVNVEQQIKNALPPRADFIASPLASEIQSVTRSTTYSLVTSDRFHTVWIGANRKLHETLVGVLTGTGTSAVKADKSGTVTLDLHTLVVNVINRMNARGITVFNKIPVNKINTQITLIKAPGLVKAQKATRALNSLAWALPLLSLACLAGAVGVAYRRRRALMWCGLGVALSIGVFAIIIGLARSYLMDAAAKHSLTPAAAAVVFDTILGEPRLWGRVIFAIGLLVFLAAWFLGPSRPAVSLRNGIKGGALWIWRAITKPTVHSSPVGSWLVTYKGVTQAAIGLVGLLILLWWGSPGIGGALVVVVIAGVLIWLLELFSRGAGSHRDETKPPSAVTTGSATGSAPGDGRHS